MGCLGILVRPGGSVPLSFGCFPIFVSLYMGGSVSSDTSNYMMPIAKRARSKAETGTELSGNTS